MSTTYKKIAPFSPGPIWSARLGLLSRSLVFFALFQLLILPTWLPVGQPAMAGFSKGQAAATAWLLQAVGAPVVRQDAALLRPDDFSCSIVVGPECSGVSMIALFVAAVLVWPAPVGQRIAGAVAGIVLLGGCNIVRIGSLYWLIAYRPDWFNIAHEEVAPAALLGANMAAILAWAWLRGLRQNADAKA
jgi:exosortase/archaeosortase family protein